MFTEVDRVKLITHIMGQYNSKSSSEAKGIYTSIILGQTQMTDNMKLVLSLIDIIIADRSNLKMTSNALDTMTQIDNDCRKCKYLASCMIQRLAFRSCDQAELEETTSTYDVIMSELEEMEDNNSTDSSCEECRDFEDCRDCENFKDCERIDEIRKQVSTDKELESDGFEELEDLLKEYEINDESHSSFENKITSEDMKSEEFNDLFNVTEN